MTLASAPDGATTAAEDPQLDEAVIITDGATTTATALEENKRKQPNLLKTLFSKSPKKEEGPKVSLGQMFRFATPLDKLLLVIACLGAIAQGAAFPVFVILFGDLFNEINSTGDIMTAVEGIVAEILYVGVGASVAAFLNHYLFKYTQQRQLYRCRTTNVGAVLRQDIAWFDATNSGVLAARIAGDTQMFGEALGENFGKMLECISQFLTGYIIGFVKGWKLALVVFGTSPLIAICGGILMSFLSTLAIRGQAAYAYAGAVAMEVLSSIRTVSSFSGEQREWQRYEKELDAARQVGYSKGAASGVGIGVTMMVLFGSFGLCLWFGAWLIVNEPENYNGGTVITVFFAVLIGTLGFGSMTPSVEALGNGRGAALKIFEAIDRKPVIDSESEEGLRPEAASVKGRISLKGINFRYPSRPDVPVFQGLDLDIEPGTTVALVGPSGCGKSSTIGLIERLYDPDAGEVQLDGTDIRKLNLRWLRSQMGLVGQEPVLFSGTIAQNIAYGKPGATSEEIIRAAKLANAHRFIKSFPDQYNTLVGEKGAQLSGGQKQRVAIARAIVRDPKILLLDEATSALDTASERIVQDALNNVMGGRTTIVVAHRLSTIRNADVIVVFNNGVVAEKGKHDELMQLDGIYAGLVRLQEAKGAEDRESAKMKKSIEEAIHEEDIELRRSMGHHTASGSEDEESDSETEEKNVDVENSAATGDIELGIKPKLKETRKERRQRRRDNPQASFKRIIKYNLPEWRFYLGGVMGSIIVGTINPAYALIYAEVLAVYFSPPNQIQEDIKMWAGLLAAIGGAALIGQIIQGIMYGVASERLTHRLRSYTFKAMLRQEIGWFDLEANAAGLLASRLATDAALVEGVVGQRVGILMQNVVTLIGGIIISLTFGWKLGLVAIACSPFLIFPEYTRMSVMAKNAHLNQVDQAGANRIATEAITNVRTVAAFTQERQIVQRFAHELTRPMTKEIRSGLVSSAAIGLGQFGLFAVQALIMWYGVKLIVDGELNFKDMIRVIMAVILAANSIGQGLAFTPNVGKARSAATEIFKLIDRKPKIDATERGQAPDVNSQGHIRLEEIDFHYPARPQVQIFDKLTLEAQPGKTLAIVGPSGSGKSSIIQLLERFYDPEHGRVLIDGVDLKTLDLDTWRRSIALVGQEPVLFQGTIADNIRYGKPGATDAEIEAAAKMANAHNFIQKFPLKYNTMCGEKGAQLSGGQKQRIAIARSIIRNPKVLLLDEATSALDTESESIVQKALDQAMVGRTTIIVAHRLSTIRTADKIAVLDQGRVKELGTYAELLEKKGAFFELVNKQIEQHK